MLLASHLTILLRDPDTFLGHHSPTHASVEDCPQGTPGSNVTRRTATEKDKLSQTSTVKKANHSQLEE